MPIGRILIGYRPTMNDLSTDPAGAANTSNTDGLRLRQLVLVAESLEPVGSVLQEILDLGRPYSDPGVAHFGLDNLVFPVGDQFLEIVAPREGGTTAGRYLERFGPGGYMVIVQVPDLAAVRDRAEHLGMRSVWTGRRTEGDDRIEGQHFHPKDSGGTILSVDEVDPPTAWPWGGADWREQVRTARVTGLRDGTLRHSEPAEQAGRWCELLGAHAVPGDEPNCISLGEDESFRFAPLSEDRSAGLDEIGLRCVAPSVVLAAAERAGCGTGADWFDLGGVRFRVE